MARARLSVQRRKQQDSKSLEVAKISIEASNASIHGKVNHIHKYNFCCFFGCFCFCFLVREGIGIKVKIMHVDAIPLIRTSYILPTSLLWGEKNDLLTLSSHWHFCSE